MIELRLVSKPADRNKMWLVLRDETELGLVTKIPNDPSTVHPFKAFVGVGEGQKYLGASYDGQGEAVRMVVMAATNIEQLANMWAMRPHANS